MTILRGAFQSPRKQSKTGRSISRESDLVGLGFSCAFKTKALKYIRLNTSQRSLAPALGSRAETAPPQGVLVRARIDATNTMTDADEATKANESGGGSEGGGSSGGGCTRKEIYTYKAPWTVFSLAWSHR